MKDDPPAIQVQHAFHRPQRHSAWRWQNAFYRAPPTPGCRHRSRSASGSNSCSFPRESRSTEKALLGTRVTAPAFSYLREIETGNERMVDQNSASWNQITVWLRGIDELRRAA
jgi:hypothetical protein